ncbi:MAG: flagellar hook-length control protein FliK [Aeromonadaceae bacterium]
MLQSITTARIESVTEVANQSLPAGNRGETAFSALMERQQPLPESAAANPRSARGKSPAAGAEAPSAQASVAQEASSAQATGAREASSPIPDELVSPSPAASASEAKKSKPISAQDLAEGVDFLQHLQASLVTPTALSVPASSAAEEEDKNLADPASDEPADKLTGAEITGGKLLPPGDALPVAMLPLTNTQTSAALPDDSEEAVLPGGKMAGAATTQPGGNSLAASDTSGQADAPLSADAGYVNAQTLVSHTHGGASQKESVSGVGDATSTKADQVELEPILSSTDKRVSVEPTPDETLDEPGKTVARTRNENKTAEPQPQLPDGQSRGEFRHAVAHADAGGASSVPVDESALMVKTQGAAGEPAASQPHQGKAQLAKEMAVKEMVPEASSGGESHLLLQEESPDSGRESQSTLQGSESDEPTFHSIMQSDNLSAEARGVSASTHGAQLSSVSHTTAERGSELYRELASVNVSSHLKAAPELAERLTLMIGQKWQEAELELEPRGMGKMTIQLSIGQDQQASVQFLVQQHHSREAVEQTLPKLKEMLAQQGILLEQATVQQQTSGQGQNGQSSQWSTRTGGDGAQGQGHSRGQSGGAQSQPDDAAGQNVSVRSRQASGIDFYA